MTRSYVVEMTDVKAKMTYKLSRLSALQYAGFAATPLLGSALSVSGAQISLYFEYSFSPYFLLALVIISVILLMYPFVDIEDLKARNDPGRALYVSPDISNPILESGSDIEEASANTPVNEKTEDSSDSESPVALLVRHGSTQYLPLEGSNEVNKVRGEGQYMKIATDEDTKIPIDDIKLNKVKSMVYTFMMFLNFTTRGALSVSVNCMHTCILTARLSLLLLMFRRSMKLKFRQYFLTPIIYHKCN